VKPGLIDIHSDYIETIASPRPSIIMDLSAALFEADRLLVTYGVTTMYHSLSIYRQLIFDHKPIRAFENVACLIDLINRMRAFETSDHLIRHRLHVRLELDAVDRFREVEECLLAGKIDLVSFMDHTPGQGQYRDLEVFSRMLKSYKGDLSDEYVRELVNQQQAATKLTLAEMRHLASVARTHAVAVASHDDDSAEKLAFMQEIGAGISEFPISREVAQAAHERGMHTLGGAPNVLLGHSHAGNLSMREAVRAGVCDTMCSDYHPAALLRAVFELHHDCDIPLPRAFALVTLNPARAVGIDEDFGELAVGKRADVLLVRERGSEMDGRRIPVVEEVLVEGRSVFRTQYPRRDEQSAAASLKKEAAPCFA
jgi:alpha-D-ribose 1-methylphosphonate 5-triphosphate diphosphatase